MRAGVPANTVNWCVRTDVIKKHNTTWLLGNGVNVNDSGIDFRFRMGLKHNVNTRVSAHWMYYSVIT